MDWVREDDLKGYKFFIAQSNDPVVLAKCASGGAFAAIATAFIEKGGIVFGAVYDADFHVVHIAADDLDGMLGMLGSKYVQSDMGRCFEQAERYLREGRSVLFSGTPCQIAGLYSFLNAKRLSDSEMKKLFTIDFVCHGVGSPLVLESYILEEAKAGHVVSSMNMRSKFYGYRNGCMELVGKNGAARHISTRIDRYLGAFFSNCISRPSCYECVFKGVRRLSTITMWDSWNAESVIGKKPDNKGYTNMIVRGKKGELLLDYGASTLSLSEVEFSRIAPANGGMLANSCKKNGNRSQFLETVADSGLKFASELYFPIGPCDCMREIVKTLFWRLGILDFISRRKRAMK